MSYLSYDLIEMLLPTTKQNLDGTLNVSAQDLHVFAYAIEGALSQFAKEGTGKLKPNKWKFVPIEPTDEMVNATFAGLIEDQSVQGQQRRRAEMKRRIALANAAAPEY